MEFSWLVEADQPSLTVQAFAREKNLSQNLIKQIKLSDEGGFFIDGKKAKVWHELQAGNLLTVKLPPEPAHPHLQPIKGRLDILFEDDHLLILNKPAAYLSSPSFNEPEESVANRVLQYYMDQDYENLTLHLVTRLDRQTSGVLIFAKHTWAHALMDGILRHHEMDKIYLALTQHSAHVLPEHGFLDFPIARSDRSIIERVVDEKGKPSLTEYWRLSQSREVDLFKVKLHTGRTHQIRVHFAHVGFPLLGDSLYGKGANELIDRQALHCHVCCFIHPFTGKRIIAQADPPADIANLFQA